MKINRRVILIIIVFFVMSTTSAVVFKVGNDTVETHNQWVHHTNEVLILIGNVLTLLIDAETGQRGYIYTEKRHYLEPYNSALKQLDNAIEELKEKTADNLTQQKNIIKLKELKEKKISELDETIKLTMNAQQDKARSIVLSDLGKNLMDSMRVLLNEMSDEEKRLLKERTISFSNSKMYLQLVIFGVYFATVIVLLFIFFITREKLLKPLKIIESNIHKMSIEGRFDDNIFTNEFKKLENHKDEIGTLSKAFKEMSHKLMDSISELEEFSYRTSHDLRSPLVSSRKLLDVAIESMQAQEIETAQRSLGYVQKSLFKLEKLVENILQLTKVKYQEEDVEEIDFEKLVDDSIEKFHYLDNFDRIHVIKKLQHKRVIRLQKSRIQLIVENMISNSIKYQDLDEAESFLEISSFEDGENFVFKVEDNGLGIPEDHQKNVFSMFRRFHSRVSFGSGLGLYMMKKSADILRGELIFESPKKGAIFKLTIPYSVIREKT